MKTVYVQYQDGIPITVNTYIAEYGYKRMGYKIIHFTLKDLDEWEANNNENDIRFLKSCIFIGGTFTLLRILYLMRIDKPQTYNQFECLPQYCHRKIVASNLGIARKKVQNQEIFFIKPLEDTKLFTGFVAASEIDFIRLQDLQNDTKVLISEVIDIKSEFRCFVNRKTLIDVKQYNGDFKIFPDINIIEQAIQDFTNQPISYTLDFAKLKDGSMELIEINDGYSLGYCGIHPYSYCRLLEDRWFEIINKG